MGSLWPNDAEDLLRAYGAERAGRPLTESEAEVKKRLAEAVARECRWVGIPTITVVDLTPYLREAFFKASCLPMKDLDLCLTGLRAIEEGRTPSEEELAAFQAHNAETERLGLLAGFGSFQEVHAFLDRTRADPGGRVFQEHTASSYRKSGK
jgi:hypothetical protein